MATRRSSRYIPWLLAWAALAVGSLALAQQQPVVPLQLDAGPLNQARSQIAHGDFAGAERTLRLYLHDQPVSADGLYLLGETLLHRNQPAASLQTFTRAAALRKPTGEDLRWVGLAYVLLNDNEDAVHWLTLASQLSPKNSDVWYSLGRAQYSAGGFASAEECFRKAIALEPSSSKAYNNLGLALVAQNRNQPALESYAKAIDLQKDIRVQSEQPLLNYGTLLTQLGRSQEAVEALTHATAIAPGCAQCHEAEGQALLALDRLPEAQAELAQAVTLEPANPRYHYELGRIYKRTGDARSAEELRRSAELYGSHSTPP